MKVSNILLAVFILAGSSAFAATDTNAKCLHGPKNQKTSDVSSGYIKTFFAQPAPAPASKPQGGGSATREQRNGNG